MLEQFPKFYCGKLTVRSIDFRAIIDRFLDRRHPMAAAIAYAMAKS